MAPPKERAVSATAPEAAPPAAEARAALTAVTVLLPVEVDQVRYAPGDTADIRAELLDALLAAGAVEYPEPADA